jgi:hypothetical protein
MNLQPQLCAWLLQLGADPERLDGIRRYVVTVEITFKSLILHSRKALHNVGPFGLFRMCLAKSGGNINFSGKAVAETFRVLVHSQGDVTATDISSIISKYNGPPEGAEIILSQELLPFGVSDAGGGEVLFPPLAMALRSYAHAYFHGEQSQEWVSLIRKLVRTGADLHGPVPREDRDVMGTWTPYISNEFGTPLDELFINTHTPAEARTVADEWLQILSSEGYDIVAYLTTEMELHSAQHQLTYPSSESTDRGEDIYDIPRELLFELHDAQPCVYWDWWIDPACPTYLVRREYRQMVALGRPWPPYPETWKNSWPFQYPAWFGDRWLSSVGRENETELPRLRDAALRRASRRLQKAHLKVRRSPGLRYPRMPGAWHI